MQAVDPLEAASRLSDAATSGGGLVALVSYGLGPLAFWLLYLTIGFVAAVAGWRMLPRRLRASGDSLGDRLSHPATFAVALVWPAILVPAIAITWLYAVRAVIRERLSAGTAPPA